MRFQLSDLYALLPGNLWSSTLWGLWIYHNIRIFLQFSEVFSDYFHPILQLVLFMIAYDCSFRKLVVSRGMVSPAEELVSRYGKHVVLRVHIMVFKVGPFLFHSTTLVISQCTTSLTSLWLPFIFFQVPLSGVRRAILLNI